MRGSIGYDPKQSLSRSLSLTLALSLSLARLFKNKQLMTAFTMTAFIPYQTIYRIKLLSGIKLDNLNLTRFLLRWKCVIYSLHVIMLLRISSTSKVIVTCPTIVLQSETRFVLGI